MRDKLVQKIMSSTYFVREVVSVHSYDIGMAKSLQQPDFSVERALDGLTLPVVQIQSHSLDSESLSKQCIILEQKHFSKGTHPERHWVTTERLFKKVRGQLRWSGFVVHNDLLDLDTILLGQVL